MDAPRIAKILDEMGTLLELRGENPFRCRAYHNAADALKGLPDDLGAMIDDGSLADVPGIGKTIFEKVAQLATSGRLESYDALRRETPPGLLDLLRVPGLGPKKIKALREALAIEGMADLRSAAEQGKIAGLKGFGAKTQQKILEGIGFIESVGDRILQSDAQRLARPIFEAIKSRPGVIRAEICGSLRRRAETIGDLDLLISADDPAPVLDAFVALPMVAKVLAHGPTKASVLLAAGVQCDLRGVSDEQFPFALHYFTGSKAHNIAMRRRALARGATLNEYALTGPDGRVPCRDEAELFQALGLAYIPPELREDTGEFEAAERGPLPKLIETADLAGTFHCHTDWSDGGATLEEMAAAARALGLHYLGIADHSRAAAYAGGLSIERARAQQEAVDLWNDRHADDRFRLFKGTECDILPDGSLDYPDDLLDGFDYVVASVHSSFTLPRDAMTARIVRAVRNPRVTMLGHPTGRLLLARDGYAVDLDAVIEAAAESGALIEINANPHRLDLDATHVRRARKRGVGIVINPDAHSTAGLADLEFGVNTARRAGLTAADVFNTATLKRVTAALAKLKSRAE